MKNLTECFTEKHSAIKLFYGTVMSALQGYVLNRVLIIQMENRVYYGEYSLAYWLELILRKKIVLPSYQRYFVWGEEKINSLIDTFKEKRFVPPVTIGTFFDVEGKKTHFIIDGQQRLTSLLLAYLNIFPDKEKYREHLIALANGEEEVLEDDDLYDNVLKWNFESLTSRGSNKQQILNSIKKDYYKELNLDLPIPFFDDHYLGFSYIVPYSKSLDEQQKYYTKLFREINIQGKNLLPVESRRALYFLKSDLKEFFEPDLNQDYLVKLTTTSQKIDFVRYLALLFAYEKTKNVKHVARRFSNKMEEYFEYYVYSVVQENDNSTFEKFDEIFPGGDFISDLNRLKNTISQLQLEKEYPSIINMDMYFFGLIYYVMIKHKSLNTAQASFLKSELNSSIVNLRENPNHATSPAQLQYMRMRMSKSLDIYRKYLADE